jgi:hypothetical protein
VASVLKTRALAPLQAAGGQAGPPWYFWVALCVLGALPRSFDLIYFKSLANRDFGIFYAAGRLAWSSGASVYDPAALAAFARQTFGFDIGVPFPYPPHALFLFAPFGALPFAWALALWTVLGLGLFTWAAQPYLGRSPGWLPLALPATLVCVTYGQTGLFVGGLWLMAFSGRPWALASLTIKPHIGFLAAFHDRRSLIPAVLIGTMTLLASVLAFGFEAWTRWIGVMLFQAKSSVGFMDMKFAAPALTYGPFGQIAFAAAAIFLLTRKFNVFTAATATLLISPYSYHYDMTVACLGFAVALAEDRPPLQVTILAAAFLTPALMIFGSWIAPPLLLAGLWVQTGFRLPVRVTATSP